MLTPEEQQLFRCLTVFVGSWTLDAVQTICGDSLTVPAAECLISLVDKHLIEQVQSTGEMPRYRMLETLREFGLAMLKQMGELLPLQRRHANHYLVVAMDAFPRLVNHESAQVLTAMRADYANIRTALRWAIAQREVDMCLRFCNVLLAFWNIVNIKEAESYLNETMALAEGSLPSVDYVNALSTAGYVATMMGQRSRGSHYLEQCIAMDEATGRQGGTDQDRDCLWDVGLAQV